MSCEQKEEQFKLHFLDCDCTCCGIRQRCTPSITCDVYQSQFKQLVKDISRSRYGLDCNCLCGEDLSSKNIESCPCPTTYATMKPIQINFNVDTGVKQLANAPLPTHSQ
ncbi:unnamed protein product [Rotaria magnacalcarata]|uniref:Uncharacterized protein n=2 Tax=Rotaria magnacalcarata TaxID=392030 RepID=A0A819J4R6_9BILA|nr:unnamed protein product [Rotaria magnacalcarata]CAF3926814.1 unnamed protein product [Rotaria magnacalcarata]